MENEKLTREQLINRVASRLFGNLSNTEQSLQDKAKIILKQIEHCINDRLDMREFINTIGYIIQKNFVAINAASHNRLLSEAELIIKGTLTKEEAQGKNLPDEKHSDLFKYLGQEGVKKIGALNLLAYKDLPLENQRDILLMLHRALNVVNDTNNELKDKAEQSGYSLQMQVEGVFDELYKMLNKIEKSQERE